jgi:hypothetical protein
MVRGGARRITPEQVIQEWTDASHRLHVGVHNFLVQAGKLVLDTSIKSFATKSYGGKAWKPWQGKYKGKGSLLVETGSMRDSLKGKLVSNTHYMVETDPSAYAGSRRNKRRICYAAVHNNLDSLPIVPAYGPRYQRPFLGANAIMEKQIHAMAKEIMRKVKLNTPRR